MSPALTSDKVKYNINLVNGGAGPLPQVHGGRVCTCVLARCRVVSDKLANQNVHLPVFGRFAHPLHPTRSSVVVVVFLMLCGPILHSPPKGRGDITRARPHSPLPMPAYIGIYL